MRPAGTWEGGRATARIDQRLPLPIFTCKAAAEVCKKIRLSFAIVAILAGLEALERSDISEYHEWQVCADRAAKWGRS